MSARADLHQVRLRERRRRDVLSRLRVAARGEQRKTVTVLFCDLTGSTELGEALDAEALRTLLARYFERMKGLVEHHGGSVEKFIGDAVMAVFGVPVLHEDDALRAVRCALEMRDALPELGLQARFGVMTGEVVTGTAERLATGDAINVAARLEQAARPGEVLMGAPTYELVRDAAEVEQVEPLALKGKAEHVRAFRLLEVHAPPARRHDAAFVGRTRELAVIRDAWARVLAEQRCELLTVVGEPGAGKSRLVVEALAAIEAAVVSGRCLPYGKGITYWPVVEALKQLDVLPEEGAVADAIASLLGRSDTPTSAEEIAWAFRKALEGASGERGGLVVVFDDIQWGEATFLDLIDHVALLATGAPILILCIARPELVDRRADWPVGLRLDPLSEQDVEALMPAGIAAGLRATIARAAGGNPLFVQEMLAMADESQGTVTVPPTLQALLGARLDRLEASQRGVLQRGAIEGEVFHRGAVQALAPDEGAVTPALAALVRRQMITPQRPLIAGEDGFRFRHLLIRDAAYQALPKALRAELHARCAAWIEQRGGELVEQDELAGYHLEQACRYRSELGLARDEQIAKRARHHLITAGRRSARRSDYAAAAGMLARAAGLLPLDVFDLGLEIELIGALFWHGEVVTALARAESIAHRAAGDKVAELCGEVQAGILRMHLEPEGAGEAVRALAERGLAIFQAAGNDLALYVAHHALAWAAFLGGQTDRALVEYEQAAHYAERAGLSEDFLEWRCVCRFYGTTPIPDVMEWLDAHEAAAKRDPWLRTFRAAALVMIGRAEEGRAILLDARTGLAERGGGIPYAAVTALEAVDFELITGNPEAAVALGTEGCRLLEELGAQGFLSTAAGTLALALYALGRDDEADAWAGRADELGSKEDVATQLIWRQARAKVLARRGDGVAAERLAREALALAHGTDLINGQGDAEADLAEVLELAGKPGEAAGARRRALACYERKGNLARAGRMRELLAAGARGPT
jgi:class 3 adenylate cyclase/tetratricopeptide (TPR) repeat protein